MPNEELAIVAANDLIPSTMEAAIQFSERMALAKLVPLHLQKSPADCLRVVLQAARWQMDPFAVADKTSVINNKLMYEGQLVSAVVNARGNLKKKLSYTYTGEGNNRLLVVAGTIQGEDTPREIELTHALAIKINKNGQMGINPDQQMSYIGARIWARRHTPELMLGVYVPDEMDPEDPDMKVVSPAPARPDPASLKRGKSGTSASKKEEPIDIEAKTPPEAAPSKTTEEAPPHLVAAPVALEKDKTYKWPGVNIIEAAPENFGDEAKPAWGCKANVSCEHFTGTVYDLKGAAMAAGPNGLTPSLLPAWRSQVLVTLEVVGKFSKVQKAVIAVVTSVTADEAKQGALGID